MRALFSWLLPPAPAERLAAVRILVGAFTCFYIASRYRSLTSFQRYSHSAFQPLGILSWMDSPVPSWCPPLFWGLTLVLGVVATAGVRWRVTGPAFALCTLLLTSYRNSWGMVFHTENLMVIHLCVLACAPAGVTWVWGRRPDEAQLRVRERRGEFGWALRVMSLVTVMSYLVAGVAKLKVSGLSWAGGEQLRSHVAYDLVRKLEFGGTTSPLGHWLVSTPALFPPLAWLTLVFELGAPLALLGRTSALCWCGLAWGFHAGVMATMLIVFPYPLTLVAFASLLPAEHWLKAGAQAVRRLRGKPGGGSGARA